MIIILILFQFFISLKMIYLFSRKLIIMINETLLIEIFIFASDLFKLQIPFIFY